MRLRLAAIVCGVCLGIPASGTPTQSTREADAKAVFLVNLARFTEWPAKTFVDAGAPLVIGVLGDEALRWSMLQAVRGKTRLGRPLAVRSVGKQPDVRGIHLLYIGPLASKRASELLRDLERQPVLTVSDLHRFCDQGGMVEFRVDGDRIRFEVAVEATLQAGLKVSSRVLALARDIHGKV